MVLQRAFVPELAERERRLRGRGEEERVLDDEAPDELPQHESGEHRRPRERVALAGAAMPPALLSGQRTPPSGTIRRRTWPRAAAAWADRRDRRPPRAGAGIPPPASSRRGERRAAR